MVSPTPMNMQSTEILLRFPQSLQFTQNISETEYPASLQSSLCCSPGYIHMAS